MCIHSNITSTWSPSRPLEESGTPVPSVPTGGNNVPAWDPPTSPETELPVQKAYKCKIENSIEVSEWDIVARKIKLFLVVQMTHKKAANNLPQWDKSKEIV
jgi:hypothetical protein